MPLWLQNLAVVLIVSACFGVVGWQTAQTLLGRKSRIGSCCAKGCGSQRDAVEAKPQAADGPQRVVFMPVEMLSRRK